MDAKPGLFGWSKPKSPKPGTKGPKSSVAVQVPPSKASKLTDPAERISAE